MNFDFIYFGKMLEMMRRPESRGYITFTEAKFHCGLPEKYKRSTYISVYHRDIIALFPKGADETVYFLRNGYDPN